MPVTDDSLKPAASSEQTLQKKQESEVPAKKAIAAPVDVVSEPTPLAALQTSKQEQNLQMSLAEAVALNLRRNIGIKLAYMDRVQQKYDFVTGYYYAYQPKISVGVGESRTWSDAGNNLTGSNTKGETRTDTALVNVDTKLPTGTRFIFYPALMERNKNDNRNDGSRIQRNGDPFTNLGRQLQPAAIKGRRHRLPYGRPQNCQDDGRY